jgi:hypothetical protein
MVTRSMFARCLGLPALAVLLCFAVLASQQGPATPTLPLPSSSSLTPVSVKEFPVNMKQEVTAGKTPAGTRVQAKLQVATLVDGTVFPRNTVFSGEVTESVAKSESNPSRVAIRMNSAQWKDGSAPVRIYLTAWFYPLVPSGRSQDLSYGPAQSATQTWNGAGTYPDPNSPASQPFPRADMNRSAEAAPESPVYILSKRRFLMKDVESEHNSDGAVTISSRYFNIKLDKSTTYVMATGELGPRKPGD